MRLSNLALFILDKCFFMFCSFLTLTEMYTWYNWLKLELQINFSFSSCGKVLFSQACVRNSVHGGGGKEVYPRMQWVGGVHPT